MSNVLYLQASPRGERSKSIAVADAFIDEYHRLHADASVDTLNLFASYLIPFDGLAVQAKYTILHGAEHTDEELEAWKSVEAVIERFLAADLYVIATPMWNFGIPYRLKQYIDLIVQPGYTFRYSPESGYEGLATGKAAFVAYARGGEYSAPEMQGIEHQKSYLETILGFMGITDVRSAIVEPTLMAGPDVAAAKLDAAVEQARKMAGEF